MNTQLQQELKPSKPKPQNEAAPPSGTATPRKYESRFESDQELKAFLDEKELLRRLPVSRRTIHNWRRAGKIPSIVIGRRVLFCWANVAEALRRLERGGCP